MAALFASLWWYRPHQPHQPARRSHVSCQEGPALNWGCGGHAGNGCVWKCGPPKWHVNRENDYKIINHDKPLDWGKFRPNNMLSASMRIICQMYKVRCRRCSLQAFVSSLGRKHLLRPPLLPRLRSVSVLSVSDAGDWGCSWTFNISPPVVTEHYRLRFPKLEKLEVYLANNPSKQEKSSAQSSTIQLSGFRPLGYFRVPSGNQPSQFVEGSEGLWHPKPPGAV